MKFFVASKIKPVTFGRAMTTAAENVRSSMAREKRAKSFRANLSNLHTSVNVAVLESSAEISSHRSFHVLFLGIDTDRPSLSSLYSLISSSFASVFEEFDFPVGACSINFCVDVEKLRRESWFMKG